MSLTPGSPVARTFARARRRLALRRAVVRAGWTLLAGVLLLEVGLAAGAALDVRAAWLPGAAALALAPALLLAARRPSTGVAAAVLDARLGTGAALTTAAEALEGRHGRFSPAVLAEAERALAGRSLRDALPLRTPAGLLLGGAAAALLPAVLAAGGAAAPGARRTNEAPAVVGLDLRAGAGAGGEAGAEAPTTPPGPAGEVDRAALAPAAPGADPLGALAPEVAAVVRERLDDALRALPPAPPGALPGEPPAGEAAGDDLAQALRAGDAAAALRALDDLTAAAAQGDPGAARRLETLRDAGRPGAGASAGGAAAPAEAVSASGSGDDATWGGAGRARLPRELEVASRRYFEASPGANR